MLSLYAHIAICSLFSSFILQPTIGHPTTSLYKTEQLYQFPDATVLENLVVRADGSILTTIANRAEIYLIQPSAQDPKPTLIYNFEGSNAATGIVETSPDNFSVTITSVTADLSPIPNSSQLWKVAFPDRSKDKAAVSKVAHLPKVSVPNGLALLMNGKRLLSADSPSGSVAIIDVASGATIAAFFDPLFDPVNGTFGVNGLEVRGNDLYFTNGAQKLFGKIKIDASTGFPAGSAVKISNTLSPAGAYDDFAIDPSGDNAFVATGPANEIEKIDLKTGKQVVAVGGNALKSPTSAAFARSKGGKVDPSTFYVTTSGGQVVKVTTA